MSMTEKRTSFFISGLPLLFFLIPRPNIPNIQFVIIPALGITCICIVLTLRKSIMIGKEEFFLIMLLVVFAISIMISALLSTERFGFSVLSHILKPLFFLAVLISGFVIGFKFDEKVIKNSLLKVTYITLVAQLVVGTMHFFDLSWLDVLYSSERASGFRGILRITGTLGNPNFFAWIITQLILIILLLEKNIKRKFVSIPIALILLILSGSRSIILLTPLMLFSVVIFLARKNRNFFFVKLPVFVLALVLLFAILLWFINIFGEHFPYLNSFLRVIDVGSLAADNSFYLRLGLWESILNQIGEGIILTWIFGLGPNIINVADNDYLYIVANYGLIGLALNTFIYILIYYNFSKLDDKRFAILGKVYILFSLIIGVQAETLGGWGYQFLIMYYAGIAYAQRKKINQKGDK